MTKTSYPKPRFVFKARGRDVPAAAAQLAEDIGRLDIVIHLLKQVEHTNITASDTQEERDFGWDMLRSTQILVKSWERFARRKLAKQYLAP